MTNDSQSESGGVVSSTALLACPFCGGPGRIQKVPTPLDMGDAWIVECESARIACPAGRKYLMSTEKDAVLAWNMRDAKTQDLLEIGTRWRADSSLEEWFPFSAQKLKSLEAEVGNSAGTLVLQNRVIRRLASELVAAIERCNELTPADQIQMLVPSVEDAIGAAEMAEHEHAQQANIAYLWIVDKSNPSR